LGIEGKIDIPIRGRKYHRKDAKNAKKRFSGRTGSWRKDRKANHRRKSLSPIELMQMRKTANKANKRFFWKNWELEGSLIADPR
jgi:hypothetical protein